MKIKLGILILAILLLLPISASAVYIGAYYMDVDAYTPNWYGWRADYDAVVTVDDAKLPQMEVFCVENSPMNGGNVLYDFYTIDDSLKVESEILKGLKASTWYAHQFAAYGGVLSNDNNDRAKLATQTAIWKTMFGDTVGAPSDLGQELMNKFASGPEDQFAYVGEWLLAVNVSNDGDSISWGVEGQNYLVPNWRTVPEPANMFLMGTGLLGLAAIGRRKFFKR